MADYPHAVTEHPDHADDGHQQHAVHHLVLELLEPLGDFLLDEESSHGSGWVRMSGSVLPIESDLRIRREAACGWSSKLLAFGQGTVSIPAPAEA